MHGTSMRELLQQVQEKTTVGPKVKMSEQDPSLTDPTATGDEPDLLKGLIKKPKKKDKGDGEIIINPTVEAALRAQDREMGTDSLVQAYKEDTPGQVVERDIDPDDKEMGKEGRDWVKNPPSAKDFKKAKVGKWKNWDNPDVKEDGRDSKGSERDAADYQQRQGMHQDARGMTRKDFVKKYKADAQAGDFHDAIRSGSGRKKAKEVKHQDQQTGKKDDDGPSSPNLSKKVHAVIKSIADEHTPQVQAYMNEISRRSKSRGIAEAGGAIERGKSAIDKMKIPGMFDFQPGGAPADPPKKTKKKPVDRSKEFQDEEAVAEIKTPRGEKDLPRQLKDPENEMMVFHPTTGVKVIDREKWELHRKKGFSPAESYEHDGAMIDESAFADLVEKAMEDIVKGMKKNKSYFDKKYGDRADAVMYATANKLATEHVINEGIGDWISDKASKVGSAVKGAYKSAAPEWAGGDKAKPKKKDDKKDTTGSDMASRRRAMKDKMKANPNTSPAKLGSGSSVRPPTTTRDDKIASSNAPPKTPVSPKPKTDASALGDRPEIKNSDKSSSSSTSSTTTTTSGGGSTTRRADGTKTVKPGENSTKTVTTRQGISGRAAARSRQNQGSIADRAKVAQSSPNVNRGVPSIDPDDEGMGGKAPKAKLKPKTDASALGDRPEIKGSVKSAVKPKTDASALGDRPEIGDGVSTQRGTLKRKKVDLGPTTTAGLATGTSSEPKAGSYSKQKVKSTEAGTGIPSRWQAPSAAAKKDPSTFDKKKPVTTATPQAGKGPVGPDPDDEGMGGVATTKDRLSFAKKVAAANKNKNIKPELKDRRSTFQKYAPNWMGGKDKKDLDVRGGRGSDQSGKDEVAARKKHAASQPKEKPWELNQPGDPDDEGMGKAGGSSDYKIRGDIESAKRQAKAEKKWGPEATARGPGSDPDDEGTGGPVTKKDQKDFDKKHAAANKGKKPPGGAVAGTVKPSDASAAPAAKQSGFKFGSKKGGIVSKAELSKWEKESGGKGLGSYMNARDKKTFRKGGKNDPNAPGSTAKVGRRGKAFDVGKTTSKVKAASSDKIDTVGSPNTADKKTGQARGAGTEYGNMPGGEFDTSKKAKGSMEKDKGRAGEGGRKKIDTSHATKGVTLPKGTGGLKTKKAKPWVNPDKVPGMSPGERKARTGSAAGSDGRTAADTKDMDWSGGTTDRMGKKLTAPHGYNQKTKKKLKSMEPGLRKTAGGTEMDTREEVQDDYNPVNKYADYISDQIKNGIQRGHMK